MKVDRARGRDSTSPPPPLERGYKGVGTPSPPPPPPPRCQRQMPRRPGDLGYDLSVAITDLLHCLGRRIRLCSCHVYNRTRLRLFAAHLTVTSWAVNHFLTPLCARPRSSPRITSRVYIICCYGSTRGMRNEKPSPPDFVSNIRLDLSVIKGYIVYIFNKERNSVHLYYTVVAIRCICATKSLLAQIRQWSLLLLGAHLDFDFCIHY